MNKKLVLIASVALVILIACGVGFIILQYPPQRDTGLKAISTKQALALAKNETCLSNSADIKTKVESLPGLAEDGGVWTGQIYDVPAGTNVEVNVATYNTTDSITGSLAYPKEYGSYNFTLTKQSDGWRFTTFTGCQP